ncbi:WXG100 family type VII secretion target [Nocardia sp. NEAU-G5]|uniref:WXG100 family type VII secretion target n=1 Tax=Nocardia albiluteola TaxID=2842303 RepID=A0ABS6AU24_9NOCA|nr:WXG100 family type VII secretion target [Nocardia albiluteola]MBU3061519.1 WXG100 family type VII secretion target [Nocardia albiluteola]
MAANDSSRISANFGDVAAGADAFISRARSLMTDLEDFHKQVTSFVQQHWHGDANDAFAHLQNQWNQNIAQLNQTLVEAGQLVHTGNSDLQSRDSSLANMF